MLVQKSNVQKGGGYGGRRCEDGYGYFDDPTYEDDKVCYAAGDRHASNAFGTVVSSGVGDKSRSEAGGVAGHMRMRDQIELGRDAWLMDADPGRSTADNQFYWK